MKFLFTVSTTLIFMNVSFAQHDHHIAESKNSSVKTQTKCPMMGGPINKKIYADYQGKRIYFAGEMCRDGFMKDPQKYLDKMAKEGITLESSSQN